MYQRILAGPYPQHAYGPFILEHGQIVGRLVYESMLARPDKLYGMGIGSNYQAQGLKLSKHFRV